MTLNHHEEERPMNTKSAAIVQAAPQQIVLELAYTDEALEKAAAALAVSLHGGQWATHYNEDQKNVWRARVRLALSGARLGRTQ
jgi:hypothetical protein